MRFFVSFFVGSFLSFPVFCQDNKWSFMEYTDFGIRYVHKDITYFKTRSLIHTMINLTEPKVLTIRGAEKTYNSISFFEEIDCNDYSRQTYKVFYYSGHMATGQEIDSHLVDGNKFIYTLANWGSKGFDRNFCKKSWEIWK